MAVNAHANDKPATDGADPAVQEHWQAIAIRGERIGYGRVRLQEVERDGKTITINDTMLHIVIKRFGGILTMITDHHIEEDADGKLLSFRMALDNPPVSRVVTEGINDNGTLRLTTTVNEESTESTSTIPPDVLSPSHAERELEEKPLKVGETRSWRIYHPEFAKVVTMQATHNGREIFEHPDGRQLAGHNITITFKEVLGVEVITWLDDNGTALLTRSPLLDTTMWSVTREEALKEIPAELDLGLAILLKISVGKQVKDKSAIKQLHQGKRAVYRITSTQPIDIEQIPTGPTQSVKQIDDKTIEVTVQSVRPGELIKTNEEKKQPPTERSPYLGSSTYITATDPQITRLAKEAGNESASPVDIAKKCEQIVRSHISRKNMSTNLATASEVVRKKEGDCTEHAVLLAALLRARGIPARVTVGIVYWDKYDAFAGHAWTEAYLDDNWIPLDGTLGQGGVGVGHIKLADSAMADGESNFMLNTITTTQLLLGGEAVLTDIEFPEATK